MRLLVFVVLMLMATPKSASAGPIRTGDPEVDAFFEQMERYAMLGKNDTTEEIANTSDRADQFSAVANRLQYDLDSNNRDESAWFTPPVLRLLLMAGHNAISYHWRESLDTSVPSWEDEIHSSLRWAIEREMQKELPLRKAFAEREMEMIGVVKKLRVSRAKEKRDWMMDHH